MKMNKKEFDFQINNKGNSNNQIVLQNQKGL